MAGSRQLLGESQLLGDVQLLNYPAAQLGGTGSGTIVSFGGVWETTGDSGTRPRWRRMADGGGGGGGGGALLCGLLWEGSGIISCL